VRRKRAGGERGVSGKKRNPVAKANGGSGNKEWQAEIKKGKVTVSFEMRIEEVREERQKDFFLTCKVI